MQMLTPALVHDLAAHDAPVCASLFMEMPAGGGDHDHIRIALKTARTEAEKALDGTDAPAEAVRAVCDRLAGIGYDDVAGGHDRRVAVFVAPDMTAIVDARFDETGVHVGPRFRLSPLIDHLDRTPDHAVLVVTSDRASLYRSDAAGLRAQRVETMPSSLSDIDRFTDQQEKGNIHGREDSGGPGTARGVAQGGATGPEGVPHHSMGGHDWREDKEQDLRRYANLVANAAQQHLGGTNLPLVVVADERLHGMVSASSRYPFLVDKGITRHPDSLDDAALRNAAARCLREDAEARYAKAWDKVAMSLGRGDGEASDTSADIAGAAAAGRVTHLFVRPGARLRGRVDDRTLTANPDPDGPDDLVDRAISDTLRNGGDVFALRDTDHADAPMVAAFRYPA